MFSVKKCSRKADGNQGVIEFFGQTNPTSSINVGCWMLEPFGQYFWNVGCWMKCLILLKSLHSTCNIQNFKYQICFSTIRMFCWMFWNWHCHLVFFVFFYINDKMALSSSELEIDVEKSPKKSKEEISKWKRNNLKKWSDELDTLIDLPVCGMSFFNDYLKKLPWMKFQMLLFGPLQK